MTILAFDTSTAHTTLALANAEGSVLATAENIAQQGQAKEIVPLIQSMFRKANLGMDSLTTVLAIKGPGSFTGIRLGLATALGLKLAATDPSKALPLRAYGLSAFDVLAHAVDLETKAHHGDRPLLLLLDTKRKDYFATCLSPIESQARAPILQPTCLGEKQVKEILNKHPNAAVAGHGAPLLLANTGLPASAALLDGFERPTGLRAIKYFLQTSTINEDDLSPFYLRPAYVYEKTIT